MTLTVVYHLNCDSSQMTDCIVINNEQDKLILQNDLNLILKWTETWQMNLKTLKCVVFTCSRLLPTTISNYTIGDDNLHRVNQHHYLGILFDLKISFHFTSLVLLLNPQEH